MKIATIVGARPQFIKSASLSKELRKHHDEIIIHTGQHYDYGMSDVFFKELSIPYPDYNLKIGSKSQGQQTGEMLASIEQVLVKETPDLVLVYGDTNSTLAGALAASKLNIKIAHVEAGLRSFDRRMPEEINRVITDHISNLLFAPTENAARNLKAEGITDGVHVVGDVMVDSIMANMKIAKDRSTILTTLDVQDKDYLVATVHRQSNTDNIENLTSIIRTLGLSKKRVIFPVHPRTRACLLKSDLWNRLPNNIIATEPLGYLDMLRLMSSAEKIVTDSGGIQKEAYIMRVPCITVRDTTEWMETVEDGWNVLVGTDMDKLSRAIEDFKPAGPSKQRFGSGKACNKIVDILDRVANSAYLNNRSIEPV
jgi:UDP-N-acetylglucosamine 2-epimerase (non-hydrolysing)